MLLKYGFRNLSNFSEIQSSIERGEPLHIYGATPSATSHFAYAIFENRPLVIVANDGLKARKIYEDLNSLGQKTEYFPEREVFLYNKFSKSTENTYSRLKTMTKLASGEVDFLVCTLGALADKYNPVEIFKNYSFEIIQGKNIIENIEEKLIQLGYERYTQVEAQGQFAIRGNIIDIYSENPYRIELFDIEVDSIRTFDISTQRSIDTLENIKILPAQEMILTSEMKELVIKKINSELKKIKLIGREKDRIEEKFKRVIEKIEAGDIGPIIDLVTPFLEAEHTSTVLDYFLEKPIVLMEEPNISFEHFEASSRDSLDNLSELISRGEALKVHENVKFDEAFLIETLNSSNLITLNTLTVSQKHFKTGRPFNVKIKSSTNYRGKIKLFIDDLKDYVYRGNKVIILAGSETKAKKLVTTLEEFDLHSRFDKDFETEIKTSEIIVTEGSIHEGFEIVDSKYVVLSYSEIYGNSNKKKHKKDKNAKKINFDDLKVGDYVVHEAHGIGKYMGTDRLEVQGTQKDYVILEYRGEDKLFIPIENLDSIYKYVVGDGVKPKINKLNSVEWSRTKQKVRKNIEDMADDLINLYATREKIKGYKFSEDTQWQSEFEDAFIYEETEGQISSIAEIKKDMESEKPMDRLLCADVGYGKTEVALRAAFKAIMDSKQVAFLVPTTILAEQHYNTIVERFRNFPVKIALLSRFRSRAQIKKDLEDLKNGFVDIVVGTHRLFSEDVKFKDLGLLIIDEEQRFGVRHKEKLKTLKENVDTLTLTATPIPRTLQMSMIGIRDMSVIDEPPEERFPVQTYVLEHNPLMVREAIIKEIERGGQVFYVTNRVQEMELKMAELKDLVPEASFTMAHGQMSERELEKTFIDFIKGEYDVLIASTIIETGLDVQNANTIIVTEANRLGLSQLYQLRGRVGRSNRIAYAYFTYEKDVSLTEVATKRLKSIKEFTEFGSGYKLALKDLEIRGSGSILGSRQSGHVNSIGYDLYIKYLKEAVAKKRGEEVKEVEDTQVDIKVNSFIPHSYIMDNEQRLEIYKKIAIIDSETEYQDLVDELIDRYSDVPKEVSNLMDISLIRNKARESGITSITQSGDRYDLKLKNLPNLELINVLQDMFRNITFDLGTSPGFIVKGLKYPLQDLLKIVGIVKLHKINTNVTAS